MPATLIRPRPRLDVPDISTALPWRRSLQHQARAALLWALAGFVFVWRMETEPWLALPAFFLGAGVPLAVFWWRQGQWRRTLQGQLPDTLFLCIFREPARTCHSILKECRTADYLQGLPMDFGGAVEVWTLMYRHILEEHRHIGDWLFFHYEQLFNEAALRRLEAALGTRADRQFPDRNLTRSSADGEVGPKARAVYAELCELARYRG